MTAQDLERLAVYPHFTVDVLRCIAEVHRLSRRVDDWQGEAERLESVCRQLKAQLDALTPTPTKS